MLNGLSILLTRENNDNIILAEKVAQLGGRAFNCPLLSILPLDTAIKISIVQPELIIFISKNAVWHFFAENFIKKNCSKLSWLNLLKQPSYCVAEIAPKIAAVGITTKNLLEQHGYHNIIYPSKGKGIYNTDSLLTTLQKKMHLSNKKILIVKGLAGLADLKLNLLKQGAKVQELAVYKRVIPQQAADNIQKICNMHQIKLILITSAFILNALIKLTKQHKCLDKNQICVVVPSQRIAVLSMQQGFKQVITASNTTHAAVMQALINYHTGVGDAR